MKYLGILIMAGTLAGGGFLAAERFRERLLLLRLLRQMAYGLKNQILYSNATLPEALRETGQRFHEGRSGVLLEPGSLFIRAGERMEREGGTPFSLIWEEELGRLPKDFPLDRSDMQALSALGGQLGYADRSMQERTLLFYLEQTEEAIESLKQELESRTRLCRCLGMAAGLFLMVVMA